MWDIKYRPKVFSDVLGQGGTTQVLQARLRDGKAFETSYLFAGGHGCGKTTLARIHARAMLCQKLQPDGNPCNQCDHCLACLDDRMAAFVETDAASHGTTADMRRLVEDLAFTIPGVPKRIYLLDEAHRMSKDAQDVLLKPIEDKRVVIIFCTTELTKIRGTIGSRCEVHEIRKIEREDILKRMKRVLEAEKVEYEEDAVLTVIDLSKGHVRDTLKKLETVAQIGPVSVEAVRGCFNLSVVSTYYSILLALGDSNQAVSLVEAACDQVGPSDVSAGLAEAAMNAYRYANKMYADFSFFDQKSAEQVHALFGANLPNIARYFLRNAYPTRLSLVCDVIDLCATGGNALAPSSEAVVAPPVKVQAPVQASAPAPQAPVPDPSVPDPLVPDPLVQTASKALLALAGVKAPVPAPVSKALPPPENVDPQQELLRRSDGIGPLGSSDSEAKTSQDHKAVPVEFPRTDRRQKETLKKVKPDTESTAFTKAEFTLTLNSYRDFNNRG